MWTVSLYAKFLLLTNFTTYCLKLSNFCKIKKNIFGTVNMFTWNKTEKASLNFFFCYFRQVNMGIWTWNQLLSKRDPPGLMLYPICICSKYSQYTKIINEVLFINKCELYPFTLNFSEIKKKKKNLFSLSFLKA
jgi:hypothetical protein